MRNHKLSSQEEKVLNRLLQGSTGYNLEDIKVLIQKQKRARFFTRIPVCTFPLGRTYNRYQTKNYRYTRWARYRWKREQY